jgi:hypothetical protein
MLASWVRSLLICQLWKCFFLTLLIDFEGNKMNTKYRHLLTYIRNISYLFSSQLEPRCTLQNAYTPFLQFKGDPPTSYGYVKMITPLSLHRYPYIDHYHFSALLMLAHKQIKENMVTRHQKSIGKHMSIITACISCNLNDINHEHGNALHNMCIWDIGWTKMHMSWWFPIFLLYRPFCRWYCCSVNEGAAMEPRVSCVLQPCDYH